jgi:hypothetical protein
MKEEQNIKMKDKEAKEEEEEKRRNRSRKSKRKKRKCGEVKEEKAERNGVGKYMKKMFLLMSPPHLNRSESSQSRKLTPS